MKKTIYIIRHGQTDNNAKGIVQGKSVNLPINETGIRQSELFYEMYSHIPFEKVYTSTLIRSQQSVQKFIDKEINHEILPALDEISWGILEGKGATMENDSIFLNLLTEWKNGNLDIKPEGGESPLDVQNRQQDFIKKVNNSAENSILVCMHGRAMRILLCTLTTKSLQQMEDFPHTNLGLYKVILTEKGSEIELFNDITHLDKLHILE